MTHSLRTFAKPAAIAVLSCLTGIGLERYRQSKYFSLHAATPIPSSTAPVNTISGDISNNIFRQPAGEIMKFGFPTTDTIRSYSSFVLSYDRRTRNANWVCEHLTPNILNPNPALDRSKIEFFEDKSIHQYFRANNDDYRGSGFDRGHLAPAGDNRLSMQQLTETFVLSNISPQVGKGFNRGLWNRLEQYTRYRARRSLNTWICSGPLYLPQKSADGKHYVKYQVLGKNHVSVPTHFFKVLLIEISKDNFELEAFVLENKSLDEKLKLEMFLVPLDSIERSAGFHIFESFPRYLIKSINQHHYLKKFQETSFTAKTSKKDSSKQQQQQ